MPTLDELGLGVDLRRQPWRYPGPPLPFAALQTGSVLTPLSWDGASWRNEQAGLDETLVALGAAAMAQRTCVLGVGSNRSASTLLAKFGSAGVSTVIPSVPAVFGGLGVGHSAHVSVAGFIAAAPFCEPAGSLEGVISAFDSQQLSCLDATEPNYLRIAVAAALPDAGARCFVGMSELSLYVSRHGVIGDENGRPIRCCGQHEIVRTLRRLGVVPDGTPPALSVLRRDPALRESLRRALAAVSVESGFPMGQPPGPGG